MYILKQDFQKSLKIAHSLRKLISKEPALKCKRNLGAAYLQIADINLQFGKFTDAEKYAEIALSNFSYKSGNILKVFEILYIALMKQGKSTDLKKLFDKIHKHPYLSKNNDVTKHWELYFAWYLYMIKDFNATKKILDKYKLFSNDSIGWQLSFILLEIYNLYALQDIRILEYKINNYLQHINRHIIKQASNRREEKRIKIIAHLLRELIKNEFNLKKTANICKNELNMLSKPNSDFTHLHLHSEIVSIDDWFVKLVN